MKCSLKVEYNTTFYDGIDYASAGFKSTGMEISFYDDSYGYGGVTFVYESKKKSEYSRLITFLKTYQDYDEIGFVR